MARADLVLVPGLWVTDPSSVAAMLRRNDVGAVVKALGVAHARGAVVGASCSGVFLAAQSGILDGGRATTSWWLAPYLRQRYPRIAVDPEASLVVDKRGLKAGAVFGVADLALHLVARRVGPTIANR